MSYGTADQTAEHIARARIGRNELRGVADQHHRSSGVVREDTHGACKLLVLVILLSRHLLDVGDDRREKVDLVYVFGSVEESQDSLEAPAGIHVLLHKRRQMAVLMLLVLHENVVSKLGVLAAGAARSAVGTAVRLIGNIEHLGVRAAGSVLEAPPVVLCRKIVDIFFLETGSDTVFRALFVTRRILVARKDRSRQVIGVKSEDLCQKIETPLAAFFLEVIAERPGTHHLKEGHVALVADGVDIVGSDASLHVTESRAQRVLLPEKIRHQGLHAGHVEHHARGSVRHQRNGADIHMSAVDIELFPGISQFI